MTTATEATPDTTSAEEQEPTSRLTLKRLRRPQLSTVVLSTALVAALALAGWLYLDKRENDAVAGARVEAVAQARTAAVALTSYDHESLREDFDAVRDLATDPFASQFDKASERLTAVLEKYEGTAQGKVVRAAVSSAARDRVEVLLFVDQTVTSSLQQQPRVDRNRIAMTLVRTDAGWRVSEAELL